MLIFLLSLEDGSQARIVNVSFKAKLIFLAKSPTRQFHFAKIQPLAIREESPKLGIAIRKSLYPCKSSDLHDHKSKYMTNGTQYIILFRMVFLD